MEIDNSRAAAFRFCPWKFYEDYQRNGTGIEPIPYDGSDYGPLDYGGRQHELLEEYYRELQGVPCVPYPESANPALEMEAQTMQAAYRAHYPAEPFEIVDVERTFKVALPNYCPACYSLSNRPLVGAGWLECTDCGFQFQEGRHVLVGKIDLAIRDRETHVLDIIDHKTEKRGAKSNLPQKWGAKDQASLYLWAARRIYKEKVGNFIVNVCTRQSAKGQVACSFPERQKLERSEKDIWCAIRDIVLVADEIERYVRLFGDKEWPANRENCFTWGYCDHYLLHRYGEDISDILENKFRPKKEYLHLGGVPIIQ